MKINITNILLGLLIVVLGWQNFSKGEEEKPQPITVTLPESYGSTGIQTIEKAVPYPVYIPSTGENFNVDSEWKKKYENAKDSLEKQKIYLESIKIKEYEKKLVDNDTIEITGYARTRGSLLDYSVDYRIKPSSFSYTPDVIIKRPSLSMGLGVEGGVPLNPNTNFLLKGNLYFENSKGNGFSVGYDTDKRVWIGVRKTFKLKK